MSILDDLYKAKELIDNSREVMFCSEKTYKSISSKNEFPQNIFVIKQENLEYGKCIVVTDIKIKKDILDDIQRGVIKTLN